MDKLQEIRETLEFSKPWWNSASEFEPLAQDEIRMAQEQNEHISYLLETVEQLQQQNTAMKEALEKAERFNSAMMSFCGDGLMVHNWHQNGDGEPWDNFFDENGAAEAFEAVSSALSTIEGGKANADASS